MVAAKTEPEHKPADKRWILAFRGQDYDLAELINQIACGDQQAFSTLYETTKRLLFGLVIKILDNRESSEEVLFDVYMQVWRQAARYDAQRGCPLSWLITIARSRAIDRLRAEKNYLCQDELTETTTSEYITTHTPETETAITEIQHLVRSALDILTCEQRQVIELSYFSGMTQSEIALHLNIPLGTVKTRTRLAMGKLREELKLLLT